MLLLAGLVAGLVIGVVTGGSLGNLANLRFRWPLFVLLVLVIREAGVYGPFSQVDGVQILYAVSLAALVAWTVWHVKRLPGVWLVALGATLNLLVVLSNGGRMPVSAELAARGSHILIDRGFVGQYVLMGPHTNLSWLADWLSIPGPAGAFLLEAYSPGDLVVAFGIALVAYFGTKRLADPGLVTETSGHIVNDPP